MVPSLLPVASVRLSGLAASPSTAPVCPASALPAGRQVSVDHSRAQPLELPPTMKRPSGVKLVSSTVSDPVSEVRRLSVATSTISTPSSGDVTASVRPSGLSDTSPPNPEG